MNGKGAKSIIAESRAAGINVSGIDKENALRRFGGDEVILIDVLRSYAAGTRAVLCDLSVFKAAGKLDDYAIAVHGIKGSSNAIFAEEVGEMAQALETAAKTRDFHAIDINHDAFIKVTEALLDELDKALCEESAARKPLAAAPETALFEELRHACETFDMDRVDRAMERLESYRYESGSELVVWLREQIINMNFEEIIGMNYSNAAYGHPAAARETVCANAAPIFPLPCAEILLVEDNEVSRLVGTGILERLKMRVDTAENGEEALRMIRDKRYDLILMDCFMPVMDGIKATERLRHMEGEYYQEVPIIALTANEAPDAKELCLLAGMDDFLPKPIDIEALRSMLIRFLPRKSLPGKMPCTKKEQPAEHILKKEEVYLFNIQGIDACEGVRLCGTRELFISILGDFYKTIDMKSSTIEDCLSRGKLREFTIEAHALKSAARIIGAMQLSEGFQRLEQYGNEANLNALNRETPALLQQYRSFKAKLLPFANTAKRGEKTAPTERIIAWLNELSSAIDRFDLDGADIALNHLEEYRLPEQATAHMDELRAYVADVAMEKIMETAGSMIDILKDLP